MCMRWAILEITLGSIHWFYFQAKWIKIIYCLGNHFQDQLAQAWSIDPGLQSDAVAGIIPPPDVPAYNMFDFENEEEEFFMEFDRIIDDHELPHEEDKSNDLLETNDYIGMIVGRCRHTELPQEQACVKRRALDHDGRPVGHSHPTNNPVHFIWGEQKEEKIEEICRVISTSYLFRHYKMRKNK